MSEGKLLDRDVEVENAEIEFLALSLIGLSVIGYKAGVTADKVVDNVIRLITRFLELNYRRKN